MITAAQFPKQLGWRCENLRVISFVCGFCGDRVSSNRGCILGQNSDGSGGQAGGVYVCPSCNCPTFIPNINKPEARFPTPALGRSVLHVPAQLSALYEEARRCTSDGCFTASVLLSRKMLMHIAVELGADKNLKFIDYVEFLASKGYVPPQGKHWVDHIRKKGNEATHEIVVMIESDASELLTFLEMLLRFNYEFPKMVPAP